jgi:Beta-lactamase enzyme family
MAANIASSLRGRGTAVGFNLTDSTDNKTGVTCWYQSTKRFYAASVIKVTILAALLRKTQEQNRQLTAREKHDAWLMITQSDNKAANALWADVGYKFVQHFLDLAGMKQTSLDPHWGLTRITAHDELTLLTLISGENKVLSKPSRIYARYLMAHVTSSQRWGVPAGAPTSMIVHVKNGWLPYPSSDWEINSIGTFTNAHRAYLIVLLTYGNPSMAYGINTIEGAAKTIHALLNPGRHTTVPASTPNPTWGIPDETVPRK